MKDSAKRAQIYSGNILRCTAVEEHVEDLIAASSSRRSNEPAISQNL